MSHNVSILHKEPDVVTVCKPASIPVRSNTIMFFLISNEQQKNESDEFVWICISAVK